jgi:putative OmpL-like beta-barrel porin-2
VTGPRTRAVLFAAALAAAPRCPGAAAADAASPAARDSVGSPPPAAAPAWLDEITLDGFLEASYSYNFNRPASATNQYRVFDFDDNTFKLDVFELVAQKPVARPRDAGFRVDLTVGGSIPRVTASAGLFRDDSGTAEDIDVHQAFASWIAPVGSGLRLDFGKFITHFGYEVIEGYDAWNDNASRSFLFGYAIPFTHMGVHATYTPSPRGAITAMVVNGWDVARDNNSAKSVGGQIALTPVPAFSLLLNGMWGPERAGNSGDPRTLLDVVAILKANGRLTLGANADWGTDQDAVGPGADAEWSGVAGYARFTVTPAFALVARAESFDDHDGSRTGRAQALSEFTLTPELRLTPHLVVRGDARVDRSNHDVFEKSQGFTDTQPTASFAVLYIF